MAPPFWYDDPVYGNHSDGWRRSWRTCIIDGQEQATFLNDVVMEVEMTKRKIRATQSKQEAGCDPAPGSYTGEAVPGRGINYSSPTSSSIFDVITRTLVDRKTYYVGEVAKIDEALGIIGDSTKVKDLKRLLDSLNLT